MNKNMIVFEVLAALAGSILLGLVFWAIGAAFGGNFMIDFTFAGLRGYQATGMIVETFGFFVGGVLGAYLVRRSFHESEQNMSYVIGIGVFAGVVAWVLSMYTTFF